MRQSGPVSGGLQEKVPKTFQVVPFSFGLLEEAAEVVALARDTPLQSFFLFKVDRFSIVPVPTSTLPQLACMEVSTDPFEMLVDTIRWASLGGYHESRRY